MAKNLYWAYILTGGETGALDKIDGSILNDLDAAVVIKLGYALFYSLDADSGAAESSPDVIAPDTNPGDKRWILTGISEITAAAMKQLKNLVAWTDWVPNLTGDADLSGYNTARYYRIGDLCFFYFTAVSKNVTTAGIIKITLPFSPKDGEEFTPSAQVHDGSAWIGMPHVKTADNAIELYKTAACGSWAGTETGVNIYIEGFFEIA